jgi:hypothetical protein
MRARSLTVSLNNRIATKDYLSLLVCVIGLQLLFAPRREREPIVSRPFLPPKLPGNASSPRKALRPIILENCKSNQELAILIRMPARMSQPSLRTSRFEY